MKKAIIFLAGILILVAILLFVLNFRDKYNKNKIQADSINSYAAENENYSDKEANKSLGNGRGESKYSQESASAGDSQPASSFPEDISSKECGFYFEKYGVCAGICPAGACVSEGRSCYCKE